MKCLKIMVALYLAALVGVMVLVSGTAQADEHTCYVGFNNTPYYSDEASNLTFEALVRLEFALLLLNSDDGSGPYRGDPEVAIKQGIRLARQALKALNTTPKEI